jgi:hypothetical protein
MISPITYFNRIKNNQHVFIYAVAGRSSSTAFQRIINSANTVWVWGEQHGIIEHMVSLINLLREKEETPSVKTSLNEMYHSYKENKHVSFYPNAIGNLDTTIDVLNGSISNLLKPWAPKLKRFGFKEIRTNMETLDYLRDTFEKSLFIFCFRDPIKQWPSVRASRFWPYSKELNAFLDEYYKLSNIYMEFAAKNNINAFVENIDLRDLSKIKTIISYLNIPQIDSSLIYVTVSSFNGNSVTDEEKTVILNSKAHKNYLQMKSISQSFY